MKFDSYSDPQHGWAKVPRTLLNKLGIEDKITPYSYQRGDFAYLEEDADLTLFCNTLKAKGIAYEFRHHTSSWRSSKIRSYASFHPKFGGSL